jgi:NAD(P)-dependent dehydrogenase (short-subunit alcohol dehydrogenase family)
MSGRLAGRVALITGASRGIGRAVAKRFAAEGAEVIAVARTQGALEELDDEIRAEGGKCILMPMNLREFDVIDRMGGAVFERFGHLDVLVGNAGVLVGLSPVGHYRPKDFQEIMDVNVTANYRLIRSFDPLLRQSDAGRAIFVTSGAAQSPTAYWGPYAASKAALESMVKCWAAEITKTNVKANLLDPGVVRTRMRSIAFPGENPDTLPAPEAVTDHFVAMAEPSWSWNGQVVRAY